MAENFSWSANVGRWTGIPVRIHMFLILFVATIFGLELTFSNAGAEVEFGTGLVTTGVLLFSIVLHELAHCFANMNLGGHVKGLMLMPWGGNSSYSLPRSGSARATVFAAGPFVNGMIFALGTILLLQSGHADLWQLTNPFRPHQLEMGEWQISLVKIMTWANFQLLWINLIPCFPFDGAEIVRGLISAMNVDLPKPRVESAIMVIGHACAFTIIGIAWLVRDQDPGPIEPAWLLMFLGGIVLIFSARHSCFRQTSPGESDWDDLIEMGYDSFFDEGSFYDFGDQENPSSSYSQWLTEKQESRLQLELEREEEEDRLADVILQKLHGDSLSSLSEDERLVLNRVSARLRRRREQGV